MAPLSMQSPTARRKAWIFRLLAILIGLLPFAVAEIALRATAYGLPSELEDPYVGFDEIHPLFVRDGDRYVTSPARLAYFRPEAFAFQKPANEFRIFCLGGSTVQGRPYAIETAFSTWLELGLQEAAPERKWEVINCGGVSYASYRLVPIFREALRKGADLVILYTGHNEFLEDRTYRDVKETPPIVTHLHARFSGLRLYNVARSGWMRFRGELPAAASDPPATLSTEVKALLDRYGGLEDYVRDDPWRRTATEHYRFNLLSMIHSARAAGVPVMLVSPTQNLRDCPPFKFLPGDDLTVAALREFEQLWARAAEVRSNAERISLLERAVAIDPRHAAALYSLGKSYEAAGQWEAAKVALTAAKEEDICPLRMLEAQYDALRDVASRSGTPLVDVRGHFEAQAKGGIPGDDWLVDHVHPSINGHQEIAALLLQQMVELRLLEPRVGWQERRDKRFLEHLENLEPAYFVHGKQRLEGLLLWTQGRADDGSPAAAADRVVE